MIRKKKNFSLVQKTGFMDVIVAMAFMTVTACSGDSPEEIDPDTDPVENPSEPVGNIPATTAPDVIITVPGTKICQLIGDYDKERNIPTQNQTSTRYQLNATDLGVPFQDGTKTWILFGDTWGQVGGDRDAIAYTTDSDPEDGLSLDFVTDQYGIYHPVQIDGISQGAFEVPVEGLIVNNKMYIYHTTGYKPPVIMGRSLLARSNNDGGRTFRHLYDLSVNHFINVSIVKVESSEWEALPQTEGEGLIIMGSGKYRASEVYLAYQPASGIEDRKTIRYFAGIDQGGKPLWNKKENDALPVFKLDDPGVGELSVSYNRFIKRWILLYNIGSPRGINLRTAQYPWGPWTEPQVIFEPWNDGGYCHFMHTSYENRQCDNVQDAGRENEWGGEYGPYQFEHFATGDSQSTMIYFTMSTWNPYTVVLMKARLQMGAN